MRINKLDRSCNLEEIRQLRPANDSQCSMPSRVSIGRMNLTHLRLCAAESLGRFAHIVCSGGVICAVVSLLAGAGLVFQSAGGPKWIQMFVPTGLVAGEVDGCWMAGLAAD